jgi:hypothetical protein
MIRLIALAALLAIPSTARAVVWWPSQKPDPLTSEPVPVYGAAAWGGYIYNWPSKYDMVFWPSTAERWICFNPKSGYGALYDDFDTLSGKDKEHLRDWLKRNYVPARAPRTQKEKLAWLERIYNERQMDDDFWSQFYRLMAYVYRDDAPTSIGYVQKAMPFLERQLLAHRSGDFRTGVLFVLGEYHRRLGHPQVARAYFAAVKRAPYRENNGEVRIGPPYYLGLVAQRERQMTSRLLARLATWVGIILTALICGKEEPI